MENFENLCMNCMNDKGDLKKCPFCGHINDEKEPSEITDKKLILQGKYIVGNKISENAESICYIGYDIKNKSKINIREFFPRDICTRTPGEFTVKVKDTCNEKYEELKKDFLDYFRALAKVRDIEAIKPVYDIFCEHETAYIITEIVDGISLNDLVRKNGKPLDWDTAKILFMPILSAFTKLSQAGIHHLAISPETLMVGKNGKIYISGFSTKNLRQYGVFSKCELYSGFAAPEQYIKGNELTQATDVYSFTATLFFVLVGFAPKDASERDIDDRLLIPIKTLKNIPPHVVSALANGLSINKQKRTQTFEALRDELTETSAKYIKEQEYVLEENKSSKKNNIKWIVCSSIIVMLILFGSVFAFYNLKSSNENTEQLNSDISDENIQENIVVPDFVGQSFDVIKKYDNEDDSYQIFLSEKVFDDKIEEGNVISQIPQPGTSVKKGSSIVLTVSKGPQFRELPQIEGLSLSYASTLLSRQGFIPSKVDEYSDEVMQGNVVGYRDFKPGDKIEYGSEVIIIVSKGSAQ